MTERIKIVVEVEPATDGLLAGLAEYAAICSGRQDLWGKLEFQKANATVLGDQISREVLKRKGRNSVVPDMHDLPELILVQYMSSPGGGRIRGVVRMEYDGTLMVEAGNGDVDYFPDYGEAVEYTTVKNPLYASKKKKP